MRFQIHLLWYTLIAAAIGLSACAGPMYAGPIFQGQALPNTPLPSAQAMPASASVDSERILFVGEDNNLYTAGPEGSEPVALTSDAGRNRAYSQPTWSPDGARMAWSRIDTGDRGFVVIAGPDGRVEIELEVPAPPFYYAWNPAGDRLAYLSNWTLQNRQTLALRLVDLSGDEPDVSTIATGQPLYFSWAPTGDFVLTHTGNSRVGISSMQGRSTALTRSSGNFTAPQWLADPTRFAYSVVEDGEQQIVVGNLRSGQVETLTYFKGASGFALSPDGAQLAYTESEGGHGMNSFGPLLLLDIASGEFRQLSPGPVVAFFWSPDSSSVYYMTAVVRGGEFGLQLAVWNGEERVDLGLYQPTQIFLNQYLRFADQYGQSAAYWSPDSSSVLFAGRNSQGQAGIWSIPVDGSPPWLVGQGVYATWPRR